MPYLTKFGLRKVQNGQSPDLMKVLGGVLHEKSLFPIEKSP
jgi:hypothetical protein